MTAEEQRIAIAEVCGWANIGDVDYLCGHSPDYIAAYGLENAPIWEIPDYVNSLDVMHGAIMFQPVSMRIKINHLLCEMLRENDSYFLDRCINATAAQRAEAFLRALNLWK